MPRFAAAVGGRKLGGSISVRKIDLLCGGDEVKLYFWDWHNSLKVQTVNMEMPWLTNDEARKEDCYTNLESAVLAGKVDLRRRIKEAEQHVNDLKQAYDLLYSTNLYTVEKLDHMKGT